MPEQFFGAVRAIWWLSESFLASDFSLVGGHGKSEPILGRGCDEAHVSEKRIFSLKRAEAIQWIRGLVRISTGKGNSAKRFGPFTEPPDCEHWEGVTPSRKSARRKGRRSPRRGWGEVSLVFDNRAGWRFSEEGGGVTAPWRVSGGKLFTNFQGALVHTNFPENKAKEGLAYANSMAPKSLWKFWSSPVSVHSVLFSACAILTFLSPKSLSRNCPKLRYHWQQNRYNSQVFLGQLIKDRRYSFGRALD